MIQGSATKKSLKMAKKDRKLLRMSGDDCCRVTKRTQSNQVKSISWEGFMFIIHLCTVQLQSIKVLFCLYTMQKFNEYTIPFELWGARDVRTFLLNF